MRRSGGPRPRDRFLDSRRSGGSFLKPGDQSFVDAAEVGLHVDAVTAQEIHRRIIRDFQQLGKLVNADFGHTPSFLTLPRTYSSSFAGAPCAASTASSPVSGISSGAGAASAVSSAAGSSSGEGRGASSTSRSVERIFSAVLGPTEGMVVSPSKPTARTLP